MRMIINILRWLNYQNHFRVYSVRNCVYLPCILMNELIGDGCAFAGLISRTTPLQIVLSRYRLLSYLKIVNRFNFRNNDSLL